MSIPVNIWHEQPLKDGSTRIVALSLDHTTIHVALVRDGSVGETEISFELREAIDLAKACLAGHERALTTPGLTRVLCAALLCLGKAAYKAGGLQAIAVDHDSNNHSADRDATDSNRHDED